MEIRAKLADLAVDCLRPGHFVVEVVASSKNLSKITVVIDGDAGVTIDDCGELSRQLSARLDEIDFGIGHYVLEVSTPGLDQPLKLTRQYRRNVGRGLKVHRRDKSIVAGKLVSATDSGIVLQEQVKEAKKGKVITGPEIALSYEDIEKAFVMVSFN